MITDNPFAPASQDAIADPINSDFQAAPDAGDGDILIDFDEITFTSGGPSGVEETVFDDMEHGDPFANGWFSFGGSVGGGGIAPNSTDLPPALGPTRSRGRIPHSDLDRCVRSTAPNTSRSLRCSGLRA